jgi:hypothetical protein
VTFTDAELEALIAVPKLITDPPRKDMLEEGGHRRNDFKCESAGGGDRFRVFMRQNSEFPEAFSVGLAYVLPEGGELILIRCNGPHGPVVNNPLANSGIPHYDFHIHSANSANMANGLRAEAGGELTTEYGTFEDALAYFVRRCAIGGAEAYFPLLGNPTLF